MPNAWDSGSAFVKAFPASLGVGVSCGTVAGAIWWLTDWEFTWLGKVEWTPSPSWRSIQAIGPKSSNALIVQLNE